MKKRKTIPATRSRKGRLAVDLGELQSGQLEEIRQEILKREGVLVTRADLIRRCVAYAWRHARLKSWGPP